MIECKDLDRYMNRVMNLDEIQQFENHILSCASCELQVKQWRQIQLDLRELVNIRVPNITEFGAKGLIHRAEIVSFSNKSKKRYTTFVAATLTAAAAAALIFFFLFDNSEKSLSTVDEVKTASSVGNSLSESENIINSNWEPLFATEEAGVSVQIDDAIVGVGRTGRARILHSDKQTISIELQRGNIAVDMPNSKGRKKLSIDAFGYKVSVLGTRFWVSAQKGQKLEVGVERGAVEVSDPNGNIRVVRAGGKLVASLEGSMTVDAVSDTDKTFVEQLLFPKIDTQVAEKADECSVDPLNCDDGRKASANTNEHVVSIDEIRQWAVDGKHQKAARALKLYLVRKPNDVEALNLTADCMRKLGEYKEALNAYSKIIQVGSAVEKNRARFRAGAVLQDRMNKPLEAAKFFEEYLSKPSELRPNTVEARMRLANCMQSAGRDRQYRELLALIVKEHGGTDAAKKAKQKLDTLK